ncbi:MAG TPA: TolC family protein, partial [Gemmatimonadaceae bacterium]|nr:TolC family protein [Gemmatimonadaceae bacterium]
MNARQILLAVVVAASAAGAQTPAPSATITFDDALRIALRQNTTLAQANNSAALTSATVRQQRLSFLPDLRLSTTSGQNYGRTFSQDEGRIIDQTTQSLNAGVQSSVTLFNGPTNVANLRSAQLVNVDRALELAKVDLMQTLQLDPRGTYEFAPPALDTTSKTNVAF